MKFLRYKKIYKFAYIFIFNTYKVFVIWHCCFTIPGELTSSNSRCITNQLTAILSPINLDLKHSRFKETVTQSQRQNPREKIILSCSLRAKIITYLAKNKFSRKKIYILVNSNISIIVPSRKLLLAVKIKSFGKKYFQFEQNYYSQR